MTLLLAFENIPSLEVPRTEKIDLNSGLYELIGVTFGFEIAEKLKNCGRTLTASRDTCVAAIKNNKISFSELKSAVFDYCCQIEFLLKAAPKFTEFSKFFVFPWLPLNSDELIYRHELKFDQTCFLYCLAVHSLSKITTLFSKENLIDKLNNLALAESIFLYIQITYPDPPIINFFPGVISVLLGLVQLSMKQMLIGLMSFENMPPHSFACAYSDQVQICENILSDLETSLPILQTTYEDFISSSKLLCEANSYLKMADTFLPTQTSEAVAFAEKALSVVKLAFSSYRSNFGPLQPHFNKCKGDIETKLSHIQRANVSYQKIASYRPELPIGEFQPMPEPFSFSSITGVTNIFGSLLTSNKDYSAFELKFIRKLTSLFNELMEEAKFSTDDYYRKINAFRFDDVLSAVDEDLPEKLESVDINICSNLLNKIIDADDKLNINEKLMDNLKIDEKNINESDQIIIDQINARNIEAREFLCLCHSQLSEMEFLETSIANNFHNLPSIVEADFETSKEFLFDIKKIIKKGQEMIAQRDKLITDLKNIILKYDCNSKYCNEKPEELAIKTFNEFNECSLIHVNLEAQNVLISLLIEKNISIISARESIRSIKNRRSDSILNLNRLIEIPSSLTPSVENIISSLVQDSNTINSMNFKTRMPNSIDASSQQPRQDINPQNNNSGYPNAYHIDFSDRDNSCSQGPMAPTNTQPCHRSMYSPTRPSMQISYATVGKQDMGRETQINLLLTSIQRKHYELGELLAQLNNFIHVDYSHSNPAPQYQNYVAYAPQATNQPYAYTNYPYAQGYQPRNQSCANPSSIVPQRSFLPSYLPRLQAHQNQVDNAITPENIPTLDQQPNIIMGKENTSGK